MEEVDLTGVSVTDLQSIAYPAAIDWRTGTTDMATYKAWERSGRSGSAFGLGGSRLWIFCHAGEVIFHLIESFFTWRHTSPALHSPRPPPCSPQPVHPGLTARSPHWPEPVCSSARSFPPP